MSKGFITTITLRLINLLPLCIYRKKSDISIIYRRDLGHTIFSVFPSDA